MGRSNRRAYAYLLIPPKMSLNKTARQRLRTIEEFAELGSGFNIAMRDLEIRGAGNILGTDQSGFISAVGFDMFMELLRETIAELRGNKVERPPEVEIHIKKDAYIPDDYVPDPTERVLLYRRLSEALSTDEVKAIEEEFGDQIEVLFFDVRKDPESGQKYGIKLIPTQVFLDESGKEFFRHQGFFPQEDIKNLLVEYGLEIVTQVDIEK